MTELDMIIEKVKDAALYVILLPVGLLLKVLQKKGGSAKEDNLDRM